MGAYNAKTGTYTLDNDDYQSQLWSVILVTILLVLVLDNIFSWTVYYKRNLQFFPVYYLVLNILLMTQGIAGLVNVFLYDQIPHGAGDLTLQIIKNTLGKSITPEIKLLLMLRVNIVMVPQIVQGVGHFSRTTFQ